MSKESYPEIITSLPEADIPLPGVVGWIAQGKDFQIVFFDIEPTGTLPPHSHSAQYGVVLEGEMTLTIAGKARKYTKGDTYYIPEGVVHQAEFQTHFRAIDFFAETDRYKPKILR
ncbi:MAG: cupin domain-containing protein [Candidatus Heimdallarchaeota archaeon]|nr:MAG: cupin domain-containing protein [Candidatus Heimdallarchaeota archaeon]